MCWSPGHRQSHESACGKLCSYCGSLQRKQLPTPLSQLMAGSVSAREMKRSHYNALSPMAASEEEWGRSEAAYKELDVNCSSIAGAALSSQYLLHWAVARLAHQVHYE